MEQGTASTHDTCKPNTTPRTEQHSYQKWTKYYFACAMKPIKVLTEGKLVGYTQKRNEMKKSNDKKPRRTATTRMSERNSVDLTTSVLSRVYSSRADSLYLFTRIVTRKAHVVLSTLCFH